MQTSLDRQSFVTEPSNEARESSRHRVLNARVLGAHIPVNIARGALFVKPVAKNLDMGACPSFVKPEMTSSVLQYHEHNDQL